MIKIFAKSNSKSVDFLTDRVTSQGELCDVFLSTSVKSIADFLADAINDGVKALFMVGNVGETATTFAETFGLGMFYDKFAEQNMSEYCKLSAIELPSARVREKLCVLPESFNHFNSTYGYQCAAYGVLGKTHVYLLPEEPREVQSVYENYIVKNLFKRPDGESKYVFKVFGLAKHDVEARLEKINPFVDRKCESANLDSKITLCFPSKTSKQVVGDTLTAVKQMFADNLYATTDKTISETVVELMESLGKKMSTAESMTGGLIASNIVDNSGASNVLYEGIVCYSVASKCARLGINPHFVDEYGVVSAEVAQAMSRGLLANGSDVAVSITGYAGPNSAPEYPVGLCYISVASTKTGVAVYRNLFRGDRNSIRQQAANMALFLVYKTFVK